MMAKTLYHYTFRENLFGIAVNGLTPSKYDPPVDLITMGQSVVWLTTQPSLTPTASDLEHMQRVHGEDARQFKHSMLLGRDTRLVVNLSTLTRKLVHWYSWMQTTDLAAPCVDGRRVTGRDVFEHFPPSPTAKEHWWIYFGTIKPARIELRRTPENMLPGVEHHLVRAIEEGDSDSVIKFTELRDRLKGLPFSAMVNFWVEDDIAAAA